MTVVGAIHQALVCQLEKMDGEKKKKKKKNYIYFLFFFFFFFFSFKVLNCPSGYF